MLLLLRPELLLALPPHADSDLDADTDAGADSLCARRAVPLLLLVLLVLLPELALDCAALLDGRLGLVGGDWALLWYVSWASSDAYTWGIVRGEIYERSNASVIIRLGSG